MENKKEVKVFKTEMFCGKCGVGEMLPTGRTLLIYPPSYPHICSNINCAEIECYKEIYPKISYGI